MKINPSAYNVGQPKNLRVPENEASGKPAALSKSEENTDKILISSQGALKAETDSLTRSVMTAIESPAAPDRLAALKEAVDNGTYYIPTDDLVDALMQRWIGIC